MSGLSDPSRPDGVWECRLGAGAAWLAGWAR
jgi:hypothetical protein